MPYKRYRGSKAQYFLFPLRHRTKAQRQKKGKKSVVFMSMKTLLERHHIHKIGEWRCIDSWSLRIMHEKQQGKKWAEKMGNGSAGTSVKRKGL